jgi:uncharacterized protein YecT (DUF1311 family)
MSYQTIAQGATSSAVRLRADINKRRHAYHVRTADTTHKRDAALRSSDRAWTAGPVTSFDRMLRDRPDMRTWYLKYVPSSERHVIPGLNPVPPPLPARTFVPHPPTSNHSDSHSCQSPDKTFHRKKSALIPRLALGQLNNTVDAMDENVNQTHTQGLSNSQDAWLPLLPQTQYCLSARTERDDMKDRYAVSVPESVRAKSARQSVRPAQILSARENISRGHTSLQPPWALSYR